MNSLDLAVVSYLNGFARKSMVLDLCMNLVGTNELFKAAVPVTILWWFWFRKDNQNEKYRDHVTITIFSSLLALFAARALAFILPFRERPLHEAVLGFVKPFGISPLALDSWNSFPSDHAVLFFAMATGIYMLSRKLGLIFLVYTVAVICFPRVYLGFHYPSDIIAGAAIGVLITLSVSSVQARSFLLPPVHEWVNRSPSTFYVCFFFLSFQIAVLFDPVRSLGRCAYRIFQYLI